MKKPVLFSLLATILSCGQSDLGSQQEHFLPIALATEVRSLDPGASVDDSTQITTRMLFDGLMAYNLLGKLAPALAERYEMSGDGKTYTFFMREAKWSNGKPITAFDVEYSWKRVIANGSKGSTVHNYYPIKNVQNFIQASAPLDEVGIRALDAKTLQVELEHPTPYFLEVVATTAFSPICAEVDKQNPHWSNEVSSAFVCSGPFTLAKHKHNDELVMVKNPNYWDRECVKLAGIKIAIVKEAITQLNMFEKGELAWAGKPLTRLPPDAVPTLQAQHKLQSLPSMGVYWFFVNTQAFPFNNQKIRKAFAYAINRQEIADHVLGTGELPACGVLPKAVSGSSKPYFADHNRELAQQLFEEGLQELGITREELPPIVLSYNYHENHQRTSLVIQQQWESAFNIKVKLDLSEWKVHYDKLVKGNYQIGAMAWYSWLRDPIYIMQTFRYRADGINMSNWEDPRYQALLASTEEELNPEKRMATFLKAEKLLMDEMPVIPIYFTTLCYVKQDGLKDVFVSGLNDINFKWASFEPER